MTTADETEKLRHDLRECLELALEAQTIIRRLIFQFPGTPCELDVAAANTWLAMFKDARPSFAATERGSKQN